MAGEIDAVGTAIDGALLGAAVEGEIQTASARGEVHANCLNCGAVLDARYCGACGQKAQVHRTLGSIGHDILHSVLHLDGKLWRTLPLLFFRPGELTRRYIHGERAKFVSPIALFLFSIFLMFAAANFGEGQFNMNSNWRAKMAAEAKTLDSQIADAERQLAGSEGDRAKLQAKLEELKEDRNGIAFATVGKPVFDNVGARIKGDGPFEISSAKAETGWPWLDAMLDKGSEKMMKNPSLAMYQLKSNMYKYSWLLILLSVPFVWLVTLGVRGHPLYDHAVFTTYSISFMSLLFVVALVVTLLGLDYAPVKAVLAIAPSLHLYKQLRYSYGLSRMGAMLRMIPLFLSILVVVTLFLSILILLGLLG